MVGIKIKHELKALEKALRKYPKQIAFARSVAINQTAFDAKRAVDAQIPKKLDNPTPFTKKGIRVKRGNKSNPSASVFINPDRYDYLRWAVRGGHKTPKRFALSAPVNQKRNKYGNMPRGTVDKLLAKRGKVGHGSTFSGRPKGHPSAKPGIYQRIGRGKKKGRANLLLLVGYRRRMSYRPRLPFYKIVKGVVRNQLPKNIEKAVGKALASRR